MTYTQGHSQRGAQGVRAPPTPQMLCQVFRRESFIYFSVGSQSQITNNYLRNTSNILRWLSGERQRKDQNVPAQKSELGRSPKSATSHHFSIKIIQQEILQNTGWRKSRFTVESWFGPKNID